MMLLEDIRKAEAGGSMGLHREEIRHIWVIWVNPTK